MRFQAKMDESAQLKQIQLQKKQEADLARNKREDEMLRIAEVNRRKQEEETRKQREAEAKAKREEEMRKRLELEVAKQKEREQEGELIIIKRVLSLSFF